MAKPKRKADANPVGRPSGFRPEFIEQAAKLCEFGLTDAELAQVFGCHTVTLYRWQQEHPEFRNALKAGKEVADERVTRSLYHRAVGYEHDAVKIFMPAQAAAPVYAPYREHIPPDTTAGIFWLKNRRPNEWREKTEVVALVAEVTDAAISQRLAYLLLAGDAKLIEG